MPAKVRTEPRTFFQINPKLCKTFFFFLIKVVLSTDMSAYFQLFARSTNILPQNALIQLQHWPFNVMENLGELHSRFVI